MIETIQVDLGYMATPEPEMRERHRRHNREIWNALNACIRGESHPYLELPEEAPDDSEEGTLL